MKAQIGKITICTKKRLFKKLAQAMTKGYNKTNPKLYYYVMGCYDSHWFGICVYRNNNDILIK